MYRIGQEEINAVKKVIESGQLFKINDGPLQECMNFEQELREKTGAAYALYMTCGKAALISALIGMGIGPGDEVIVPGYTYIATAMAVLAVGAIPVICECDETLTIDVADCERKISSHTRAIIPVHIQSFPCDMEPLTALAKKHGIKILEDACQSNGGTYHGKRLGTIGDAGTFSFNFFKIISAGEGGALLTNDRTIYERALIYHDSSAIAFFGNQMDGIHEPTFGGVEYRANEIQAAIMREQLKKLDDIVRDLRHSGKILRDELGSVMPLLPSHDAKGDCNVVFPVRFETRAQAEAFATYPGVYGTVPINTGKHVYTNWDCIMEKRGALHPLMDPYKMEANKNLNHNYSPDMCPNTLQYLSTVCYVGVRPWGDITEAELAAQIKTLKEAYAHALQAK